MLNIKIFKTVSSYSDTAVIAYIAIDHASYCDKFATEVISIKISQGENQK